MIALLFSPIGKIATATLLVVMLAGGIYMRIKFDAQAELKSRLQTEELERLSNAIRSGDAVDVGPGGLLKDDGHRRD